MTEEMPVFKDTAFDHMHRESQAGGQWTCACPGCADLRRLVGIDKVLNLRPLVRELSEAEERLDQMPDGPEKGRMREQYLNLHDRLAAEVTK